MKQIITLFAAVSLILVAAGCSKDEKKISGSEATGETVKITPESVRESMKSNNGMNR